MKYLELNYYGGSNTCTAQIIDPPSNLYTYIKGITSLTYSRVGLHKVITSNQDCWVYRIDDLNINNILQYSDTDIRMGIILQALKDGGVFCGVSTEDISQIERL